MDKGGNGVFLRTQAKNLLLLSGEDYEAKGEGSGREEGKLSSFEGRKAG